MKLYVLVSVMLREEFRKCLRVGVNKVLYRKKYRLQGR